MALNKSKEAFRTISEAAEEVGVATHVLRFWETKFPQIQPVKRSGGRRYYRPEDIDLITKIKDLLHGNRYTIEGVQKLLKTKKHTDIDLFLDSEAREDVSNVSTVVSLDVANIADVSLIRNVISELEILNSELKTYL